MTYTTIIFGVEGVFSRSNLSVMNRLLQQRTGVTVVPQKSPRFDFYVDFQAGMISEDEYLSKLAQASRVKIPVDALREEYVEAYQQTVQLRHDLIDLARALPDELITVGLSTTNSLHRRALKGRGLYEWMDHVYFSHELGLKGPEHLTHVLKEERVPLDQIIYVDEDVMRRTEGIRLGLRTFSVYTAQGLAQKLESLGVAVSAKKVKTA